MEMESKGRGVSYRFTIQSSAMGLAGGSWTGPSKSSLPNARYAAFQFAMSNGWIPPKWWQFWRWGDTTLRDVFPDDLPIARKAMLKRALWENRKTA